MCDILMYTDSTEAATWCAGVQLLALSREFTLMTEEWLALASTPSTNPPPQSTLMTPLVTPENPLCFDLSSHFKRREFLYYLSFIQFRWKSKVNNGFIGSFWRLTWPKLSHFNFITRSLMCIFVWRKIK